MAFKTILLASALAFGGTAIAQDTMTTPTADPAAQTQTTTPPPADPAAPPPAAPMTAPPAADPAAPMTSTMPAAPGAPMTSPAPMQSAPMTSGTFSGTETAGGYQPANPPMTGMAQPGVTPIFQPGPSIEQAYPAPAPLQSYPICKKGQTDKCRQRGG
ncbi:hypothetical protein [uncultured Sphingomonas sp.]|uniref:hypothetical protein n=1 Tax=uncultured Sphingomonas sp. TaxID=158754 RepID=UPI0025E26DF6|nr:hypothetical protein [uncultured Sphingomonas sp.]